MTGVASPHSPSSDPIHLTVRIENPARFFLAAALALAGWTLLHNLWVTDDAFITLRTLDNFLHGYGLVWNAGERVQAFTHPLWLFVLMPFAQLIDDPLYVFYLPSLLLSGAVVYLTLTRFSSGARTTVLAALVMTGSAAFIDYSSSGLENPLTHFLLALLLIQFLRADAPPLRTLQRVSLLTGLAALNRLDSILLFGPVLALQIWECRAHMRQALLLAAAGFIPLLLWEGFSLFYYGFPFPNTFYAKGRTSLEGYRLFEQGQAYFGNSLHWDPLTLGTVALALVSVAVQRDARRGAVAAGILLYLLYVLSIGGDFMAGRFFSAVFLAGMILLMTFDTHRFFGPVHPNLYYVLLAGVLFVGLSTERPPLLMHAEQTGIPDDVFGIANEKFYYFGATGWVNHVRYPFWIDTALEGAKARAAGVSPVDTSVIGIYGYFAGPEIYIIDNFALADPLRARLPAMGGRIGHYERPAVPGYLETIQGGFEENCIENPDLRLYYKKLSILTRADLLAPGRMNEIINFNLGNYDFLMDRYVSSLQAPP